MIRIKEIIINKKKKRKKYIKKKKRNKTTIHGIHTLLSYYEDSCEEIRAKEESLWNTKIQLKYKIKEMKQMNIEIK